MSTEPESSNRSIGSAGFLLGVCALLGMGLMTTTYLHSKELIRENERQVLLNRVGSVLIPGTFNNDVISDTVDVTAPDWLGSKKPLRVYRARLDGEAVAAVVSVVVPDGYNGPIRIIVGIDNNNEITGVRVISHRETPGLGDAIEEHKSKWIYSFNGLGLHNVLKRHWAVKKDGGQFDQFTGATITPRAIVKAVYKCLQYYELNRRTIFANSKTINAGKPNGKDQREPEKNT